MKCICEVRARKVDGFLRKGIQVSVQSPLPHCKAEEKCDRALATSKARDLYLDFIQTSPSSFRSFQRNLCTVNIHINNSQISYGRWSNCKKAKLYSITTAQNFPLSDNGGQTWWLHSWCNSPVSVGHLFSFATGRSHAEEIGEIGIGGKFCVVSFVHCVCLR